MLYPLNVFDFYHSVIETTWVGSLLEYPLFLSLFQPSLLVVYPLPRTFFLSCVCVCVCCVGSHSNQVQRQALLYLG